MKMFLLATAACLAIAPAAMAGGQRHTPAPTPEPVVQQPAPQPQQTYNTTNNTTNGGAGGSVGDVSSRSRSRSSASATGGNSSATGGNASAAGGAGGRGGSVTNNVRVGDEAGAAGGTIRYEGRYTVRNNPDLAALVASTANACATPAGGTFSGFSFGFGLFGTPESTRCNNRADAAALAALGYQEEALLVLAQGKPINDAIREAQRQRTEAFHEAATRPAAAPVPVYCQRTANESVADRLMRERACGG